VIVVGKIRASLCEELTKSGFSDSAQMKSKAAIMQMIKDHFGLFWRDDLDLRSLNHEKPAFAWAIRLHGGTKEFRDNRDAEKRLWIVELGKNIANEHGAHALETKWLMKNGYIDVIGEIVANYKGDFEEFKKEVLAQMAEKNLEPI
jgi:hypothetical protein